VTLPNRPTLEPLEQGRIIKKTDFKFPDDSIYSGEMIVSYD
jgi:hypothetical protein